MIPGLRNVLIGMTVAAWLVGCSRAPETGPGDVRWDRDICARCSMAVSDHSYSAQVRGGPASEPTSLYFFDDLGCAVLWFDQQAWKDDPRTEIWVNDHRDERWIDARTARYVTGKTTPMDFGLGAQDEAAEGTLEFDEAVEHIRNRKRPKAHRPESEDVVTP